MSIDPYFVYEKYSILKLHFSSPKYDAIKYNWKSKSVSKQKFLKRKDRTFFWKLSKKFIKEDEFFNFLVCNFVYESPTWIGDFVDENAFSCFKKYQKLQEGFTYQITSDIMLLRDTMLINSLESPNQLIKTIEPGTNFPYIINLALRKDINIETLILMNRIMSFLFPLNKKLGGGSNFIWNEFYQKLTKYERIMKSPLDNDQVKTIMLNTFQKEIKKYEI